jgi:hypothetical protein
MSQFPPPIPVNYQSPMTPPPRRGWSTGMQMLAGLGLGTLVSLIIWVGGWRYINEGKGVSLIVIVPLVKLIAGVTFLCFRGWRGFGGGILLSIALGFLIFFVTCAANLKI